MNILFVLKYHRIGGIEIVSRQLANIFIHNGHNVSILSLDEDGCLTTPILNSKCKFYVGYGFNVSKKNTNLLRRILIEENINVVINQWGLPYTIVSLFHKSSKGLEKIKLISAYHNDPVTNARTKQIEERMQNNSNLLIKGWFFLIFFVSRMVTGISMNYVYRCSDYYVLLSKSFINGFKLFAFNNAKKVAICPNPLTIDFPKEKTFYMKEKEILYVGRMELNQKRVDRVLDIWNEICNKYPDWAMTLVGDGVDKAKLVRKASVLGLKRVNFEGFQIPDKYYKRGCILLLTSEYEGFGLVLIEAMAHGVIPVVLGSYKAVFDIVDHNVNGFIIDTPFAVKDFVHVLEKLFIDEKYRLQIATNAILKSKIYTDDNIYKCWKALLV